MGEFKFLDESHWLAWTPTRSSSSWRAGPDQWKLDVVKLIVVSLTSRKVLVVYTNYFLTASYAGSSWPGRAIKGRRHQRSDETRAKGLLEVFTRRTTGSTRATPSISYRKLLIEKN